MRRGRRPVLRPQVVLQPGGEMRPTQLLLQPGAATMLRCVRSCRLTTAIRRLFVEAILHDCLTGGVTEFTLLGGCCDLNDGAVPPSSITSVCPPTLSDPSSLFNFLRPPRRTVPPASRSKRGVGTAANGCHMECPAHAVSSSKLRGQVADGENSQRARRIEGAAVMTSSARPPGGALVE